MVIPVAIPRVYYPIPPMSADAPKICFIIADICIGILLIASIISIIIVGQCLKMLIGSFIESYQEKRLERSVKEIKREKVIGTVKRDKLGKQYIIWMMYQDDLDFVEVSKNKWKCYKKGEHKNSLILVKKLDKKGNVLEQTLELPE